MNRKPIRPTRMFALIRTTDTMFFTGIQYGAGCVRLRAEKCYGRDWKTLYKQGYRVIPVIVKEET